MEDELYGDDLYGGGGFTADDSYAEHEAYHRSPAHVGNAEPSSNHVNASYLEQRSRVDDDVKLGSQQTKLRESVQVAERWRTAFREVAVALGFSTPTGRDPDVATVIDTVRRLRSSEQAVQGDLKQTRRKEAALQIQLAEKNLEAIDLRKELTAAYQAADPAVIQLKQLLLDPAVNKEFQRLKTELEEAQRELKHAQEELQAVTFTQESKIGRQLMAKCRSLQEENEEMGRELAEGKQQQIITQLKMAREYAEEMRRCYLELEDHCSLLDDEAEEMQREIFTLKRKVLDLEPSFRKFDGPGFRGRGRGRLGMDFRRPPMLERDGPPLGGRGSFLPLKRIR